MKNSSDARAIKIAYIGGGSRNWARMIMTDLARCPHLTGRLALYDIDHAAARRNVQLAAELFGHRYARTTFQVQAVRTIERALQGADFVIISILPGPMTMMARDLDIPERYGILHTVGDTTGPGGIVRALRTIPIYLDFARQIGEHCPDAWVINYTNPMTLCTAALYRGFPEMKAFGCCHEVFGTQRHLAELVKKRFRVESCAREEINLDIAGVNHFTHATAASWKGQDLFPVIEKHIRRKGFFRDRTEDAQKRKARGQFFASDRLVSYDFFARFGVLGAAGDRHLVEFVPWYLRDEATLHSWGVIATPSAYRLGTWRPARGVTLPKRSKPRTTGDRLQASGEEGVEQMLALLGFRELVTNVNLPNRGQVRGLPDGAVVETYARFGRDSVMPLVTRPLPPAVHSLVERVVRVQQITLEAAAQRDPDLAFQALLADPMMNISTDLAREMFDEMLQATKPLLVSGGWKL